MRTLGTQLWRGKPSVPQKIAHTAARTFDGNFVSRRGHNCLDGCAHESCATKRWVYKDNNASCWRIREIGLGEHTTCSACMQGTAPHLPLAKTLKLQYLLASNCHQRALALMQEALWDDPLVSKMTAEWIANGCQHCTPHPLVPRGRKRHHSPFWPPKSMTGMSHIASCNTSRRMGHALLRALLLETSFVMRRDVEEKMTYSLMANS